MSVHEDNLIVVAVVGTTVRVHPKDQSALAVVNRETISGEKERSFPNSQVLVLPVTKFIVHKQTTLHFFPIADWFQIRNSNSDSEFVDVMICFVKLLSFDTYKTSESWGIRKTTSARFIRTRRHGDRISFRSFYSFGKC